MGQVKLKDSADRCTRILKNLLGVAGTDWGESETPYLFCNLNYCSGSRRWFTAFISYNRSSDDNTINIYKDTEIDGKTDEEVTEILRLKIIKGMESLRGMIASDIIKLKNRK